MAEASPLSVMEHRNGSSGEKSKKERVSEEMKDENVPQNGTDSSLSPRRSASPSPAHPLNSPPSPSFSRGRTLSQSPAKARGKERREKDGERDFSDQRKEKGAKRDGSKEGREKPPERDHSKERQKRRGKSKEERKRSRDATEGDTLSPLCSSSSVSPKQSSARHLREGRSPRSSLKASLSMGSLLRSPRRVSSLSTASDSPPSSPSPPSPVRDSSISPRRFDINGDKRVAQLIDSPKTPSRREQRRERKSEKAKERIDKKAEKEKEKEEKRLERGRDKEERKAEREKKGRKENELFGESVACKLDDNWNQPKGTGCPPKKTLLTKVAQGPRVRRRSSSLNSAVEYQKQLKTMQQIDEDANQATDAISSLYQQRLSGNSEFETEKGNEAKEPADAATQALWEEAMLLGEQMEKKWDTKAEKKTEDRSEEIARGSGEELHKERSGKLTVEKKPLRGDPDALRSNKMQKPIPRRCHRRSSSLSSAKELQRMLMSEGAGTFSSTEKEVIPERRTKKQLGEGKSAVDVRNAGRRRKLHRRASSMDFDAYKSVIPGGGLSISEGPTSPTQQRRQRFPQSPSTRLRHNRVSTTHKKEDRKVSTSSTTSPLLPTMTKMNSFAPEMLQMKHDADRPNMRPQGQSEGVVGASFMRSQFNRRKSKDDLHVLSAEEREKRKSRLSSVTPVLKDVKAAARFGYRVRDAQEAPKKEKGESWMFDSEHTTPASPSLERRRGKLPLSTTTQALGNEKGEDRTIKKLRGSPRFEELHKTDHTHATTSKQKNIKGSSPHTSDGVGLMDLRSFDGPPLNTSPQPKSTTIPSDQASNSPLRRTQSSEDNIDASTEGDSLLPSLSAETSLNTNSSDVTNTHELEFPVMKEEMPLPTPAREHRVDSIVQETMKSVDMISTHLMMNSIRGSAERRVSEILSDDENGDEDEDKKEEEELTKATEADRDQASTEALILWEEEASQHPSEIKRKKKKATKEEREKEFNKTLSIESTAEKKEESEEYELLSDDGEYDQFEEDDYDFEFDEDDEGFDEYKESKKHQLKHYNELKYLVSVFFSDFEGGYTDLVMGLLLVASFHRNTFQYTEDIITEKAFLVESQYWMKYAAAAYGRMLGALKFRKKVSEYWEGDRNASDSINAMLGDKRVVMEHLPHLTDKDLVCWCWNPIELGNIPGYFVAVDHQKQAVVLALRGSSSHHDALTDLVGKYTPFLNGFAHKGILHSTRLLKARIEGILFDTFADFPGYKFIVCGHSLGGGCTSLFTLLFHDAHPEVDIHGYAFACPSTTSAEVADDCHHLLDTFIYGDDLVPRISLGALEELKLIMAHFLQEGGSSHRERLLNIAKHALGAGEATQDKLRRLFFLSKEKVEKDRTVDPVELERRSTKLYPPGRIVHMYKRKAPRRETVAEWSNRDKFDEIIMSPMMFTDHMPYNYEKAFKACINPESRIAKKIARRFTSYVKPLKMKEERSNIIVQRNPLLNSSGSQSSAEWKESLQQKLSTKSLRVSRDGVFTLVDSASNPSSPSQRKRKRRKKASKSVKTNSPFTNAASDPIGMRGQLQCGSPKSRRSPLGGSAPEQERSYRTKNRDRMRGKGVQSSRKEKEKKEAEIEIDIAQTEEKQSKKEVDTGDKRVDGNIRIDDEKKRKEETSAKKKEESEKERKKEEHDQRSENNEQEKQRRERTAKDKKDKAENGEKAPRKAKGDEKASAKKMSDDSKEKGSSSLTEFISEHSSNSKSERSEEDDLSHNGKKQPEHGDQDTALSPASQRRRRSKDRVARTRVGKEVLDKPNEEIQTADVVKTKKKKKEKKERGPIE